MQETTEAATLASDAVRTSLLLLVLAASVASAVVLSRIAVRTVELRAKIHRLEALLTITVARDRNGHRRRASDELIDTLVEEHPELPPEI